MATPRTPISLETAVRTCQIIIAAMVSGVVPLMAISFLIGPLFNSPGGAGPPAVAQAGGPGNPLGPILTYAAVGCGALALVLSFILPGVITANARKALVKRLQMPQPGGRPGKGSTLQTIDAQQSELLPIFQGQLILGVAILEGATFFAAVGHLLIGDPILLGVVGVLIAAMIGLFPTMSKLTRWLEQQQEKLREDEFAPQAS
jgi:hypothetical protein